MPGVRAEAFVREASSVGADLDEPALDRLLAYARLLAERAVPLGMISKADAGRILERHVLDSLRAVSIISEREPGAVVDLGSGAGLPGIPLAIACRGTRFTLAEARSKRAAFLELVVERLGLDAVRVHPDRTDSLESASFDMATARAFAQPDRAWELARPLLAPGGALVLFAGAREPLPSDLPGASDIRTLGPATIPDRRATRPGQGGSGRTSGRNALASVGDLVIITAK